jgi:hypothetical protein
VRLQPLEPTPSSSRKAKSKKTKKHDSTQKAGLGDKRKAKPQDALAHIGGAPDKEALPGAPHEETVYERFRRHVAGDVHLSAACSALEGVIGVPTPELLQLLSDPRFQSAVDAAELGHSASHAPSQRVRLDRSERDFDQAPNRHSLLLFRNATPTRWPEAQPSPISMLSEGVRVLESSLSAPVASAVLHLLANPRILDALARYRMFEPATTNATADWLSAARGVEATSATDDPEEWKRRVKVQIRMRQGVATKAWHSGDRPLAIRSVNKSFAEMKRQMARLSNELDSMTTRAAAVATSESESDAEAVGAAVRHAGHHSPTASSESGAESEADENFDLYTIRPFGAEARRQKKTQKPKMADPPDLSQHGLFVTDQNIADDPIIESAPHTPRTGWFDAGTAQEAQGASADVTSRGAGQTQGHANTQKRWGLLRECFHSQRN